MILQETTARLLFMAVRWVRCLAPFQTLSKHDQVGNNNTSVIGMIMNLHQVLNTSILLIFFNLNINKCDYGTYLTANIKYRYMNFIFLYLYVYIIRGKNVLTQVFLCYHNNNSYCCYKSRGKNCFCCIWLSGRYPGTCHHF